MPDRQTGREESVVRSPGLVALLLLLQLTKPKFSFHLVRKQVANKWLGVHK